MLSKTLFKILLQRPGEKIYRPWWRAGERGRHWQDAGRGRERSMQICLKSQVSSCGGRSRFILFKNKVDTISFALERRQLCNALDSLHGNAPGDPHSLLLLSVHERETRLGDEGARHIMKEGCGACEFSSGNHWIRNGPAGENQSSGSFQGEVLVPAAPSRLATQPSPKHQAKRYHPTDDIQCTWRRRMDKGVP